MFFSVAEATMKVICTPSKALYSMPYGRSKTKQSCTKKYFILNYG